MKKNKVAQVSLKTLATSLAVSLAASAALAEEAAKKASFTDNMQIQYIGVLDGSSLGNPFSAFRTDDLGYLTDDPVTLNNSMRFYWKVTDTIKLGPVINFTWAPSADEGETTKIQDPYFRIINSKLITNGNFNLGADLRLGIPASDASQKATLITYIASVQNWGYSIPDSRFSLGADTVVKANIFRDATPEGKEPRSDMSVAATPYVSYQLHPKLSTTLYYDMGAKHLASESFTNFYSVGTALIPALGWDALSNLSLEGSLSIKTGERAAADTTMLGLTIVWTMM